jgi:hypothetical protein
MDYTIEDVRYYMQYPAMITAEIQRLQDDIHELTKRNADNIEVPSYIKASQLRHTPSAHSVDSKIEYIVIKRLDYLIKLEQMQRQWQTFEKAIQFIRKSLYNLEKQVIDMRYTADSQPFTYEYIALKSKHSARYCQHVENSICKRVLNYYYNVLVK